MPCRSPRSRGGTLPRRSRRGRTPLALLVPALLCVATGPAPAGDIPVVAAPGVDVRCLERLPAGGVPVAHALDAAGRLLWVDRGERLLAGAEKVVLDGLEAATAVVPVDGGWLLAAGSRLWLHDDRDGDLRADGPARELAVPASGSGSLVSLVRAPGGAVLGRSSASSTDPAAPLGALWRCFPGELRVEVAGVPGPAGQGIAILPGGEVLLGCHAGPPVHWLGPAGVVPLGPPSSTPELRGSLAGGVACAPAGAGSVLWVEAGGRRIVASCVELQGGSLRLAPASEALRAVEPAARLAALTQAPAGAATCVLCTPGGFAVLRLELPASGVCPPAPPPGHLVELRRRLEAGTRSPMTVAAELAADPTLARLIAGSADAEGARSLMASWSGIPANARDDVARSLASRAGGAAALLYGLGAGTVPRGDLGAGIARLAHAALRDDPSAPLLEATWGAVARPPNGEIRELLARTIRALDAGRGDRQRGAALFETHCAKCHRLGGRGAAVGPSLEAALDGDGLELARSIVHPNEVVPRQFMATGILLTSGELLQGLVTQEEATQVTLRREAGVVEKVPRSRIRRIVPSTLSLMPEGLLSGWTEEQIRDLFAHLAMPVRELALRVSGPSAVPLEDVLYPTSGEAAPAAGGWRPVELDGWSEVELAAAGPRPEIEATLAELAWTAGEGPAELSLVVTGALRASLEPPANGPPGGLAADVVAASRIALRRDLAPAAGRAVLRVLAAPGMAVRVRLRIAIRDSGP